jgi:transcriptional regulator with XRE-family HTH domain
LLNFSERLVILRKSQGLTQKELADKIGVTNRGIAFYEAGRIPNSEIAIKIADLFDVSLDFLLGRSDFNSTNVALFHLTINSELKKEPRGVLFALPPADRAEKLTSALRTFPSIVHQLRTERNLSVQEMSTSTGIPLPVLVSYENKKLDEMPKRRYLEQLAKSFHVPCDKLFGISDTYNSQLLAELLRHAMNVSDMTESNLAKLVNISRDDVLAILGGKLVITSALLLFRLSYALPLTVPKLCEVAGYSYFDYDCYDLITGQRVDPPNNVEEIAHQILADPDALKLLDEYLYADEKEKKLLLDIWRKLKS